MPEACAFARKLPHAGKATNPHDTTPEPLYGVPEEVNRLFARYDEQKALAQLPANECHRSG